MYFQFFVYQFCQFHRYRLQQYPLAPNVWGTKVSSRFHQTVHYWFPYSWAMNSSTKATTIALPTPITTSFPLTTVPSIRAPPITATVRPTPPISIPCAAASTIIASNKKKSSPFSDDNSIWTIPPVPPSGGSSNNCSGDGGGDGSLAGGGSGQDPPPPISPTTEENSNDSSSPPPPPPPPAIGGGPWSPSLFRPVSSSPSSAFHTPPPVVKPVVRPPPFPSPQLPCVLPPPPLAYLTDVSTPSASTQSTTVSNVDSEAVMAGATTAAVAANNTKEVFPSPPIAPIAPSSVATISHHQQAGVSPSGISRLSSGSGGSGSAREAILCNSCGQLHDPHAAHVYDYSETVDADLLCRVSAWRTSVWFCYVLLVTCNIERCYLRCFSVYPLFKPFYMSYRWYGCASTCSFIDAKSLYTICFPLILFVYAYKSLLKQKGIIRFAVLVWVSTVNWRIRPRVLYCLLNYVW